MKNRRTWKPRELSCLREPYPNWPWADLLKALPGRSRAGICNMACELGIKRQNRVLNSAMNRPKRQPRNPIIRQLREERINQRLMCAHLSLRMGYSKGQVGKWEREKERPGFMAFMDWQDALGVTLEVKRAA